MRFILNYYLFVALALGLVDAAGASTFIKGPALFETPNVTVSGGGVTTLDINSETVQQLTGTANQTYKLPSGLLIGTSGRRFDFDNRSTGTLTVQYQDGTQLMQVRPKHQRTVRGINMATANGTWDVSYSNFVELTGDTMSGDLTWSGSVGPVLNSTQSASSALVTDASRRVTTSAVTATELGYLSGTTAAVQPALNAKVIRAGDSMTGDLGFSGTNGLILNSGQTAARAVVTDASRRLITTAVTATELGYVSGATSNIQAQLNALASGTGTYLPLAGGTMTGDINLGTSSSLILNAAQTASRVLVADASRKVTTSAVTSTELGYLSGVTSAIQTQLANAGNGSGGGAKNYLSTYKASLGAGAANPGNGDFETGTTTGWSVAHTTVSSGVPNQASGSWTSSVYGALTATTTSPLQKTTSGLWSFSATSVAIVGDMLVTDPFYIDAQDLAKPLSFRMSYNARSGSQYVDWSGKSTSTFQVWVYPVDGTNAGVWQQPSGVWGFTQSSGNGFVTGSFQSSSDTTRYRLAIIVVNGPGASPLSLAIDDASVGPQPVTTGVPATDLQSVTMSISAVSTAPTIGSNPARNEARARRVGDSAEFFYNFLSASSPAGASAGSGTYLFTLPTGMSIDTSKFSVQSGNNFAHVGTVVAFDSGNEYHGNLVVFDSTHVFAQGGYFTRSSASTVTPSAITNNTFPVSNANTGYSLHFTVPIAGWSSNVQMSSDFDGRIISFNGGKSATQAVSAGTTDITFTTTIDRTSSWNGSQFVVPVSGDYVVGAYLADNGSTSQNVSTYVNGIGNRTLLTIIGGNAASGTTLLLGLKANDIISLRSGASTTLAALGTISIHRLSGAGTTAATETVTARYTTTAGQSIPSATTAIVNYDTRDTSPGGDSHGTVTTGSSWRFTAQTPGRYSVKASAHFATASFTAGNDTGLLLYKNGVLYSVLDDRRVDATSVNSRGLYGSDSVYLLANEYFDVRIGHGESTARSLVTNAGYNHIAIEKVGN
jgi:hypothetical protein